MIFAADRCRERSPNVYIADSLSEIANILNPRLGDVAAVIVNGASEFWRLQESSTAPDDVDYIQSNACEYVWVRSGVELDITILGATGDGSDETDVFEQAFAIASELELPLLIPARTYKVASGTRLVTGNIPYIYAYGAILGDLKIIMNGTDQRWMGGTFTCVNGTDFNEVVQIIGTNCTFEDFTIDYSNMPGISAEDAYTGIEVSGGTIVEITNGVIDMKGRSSITVLYGQRIRISDLHIHGFDDGIVLKASTADVRNVTISGITAENHANIVSFGTETAFTIADVNCTNLTGINVTTGVWFKAGKVGFANGVVEDVNIFGMNLTDNTGARYQQAVYFTGLNGSITRRIVIEGVEVRARCLSAFVTRAFVHLNPNACTFQDISISKCKFRDAEGGVTIGTGLPVVYGIYHEPVNGGILQNVTYDDILIDGSEGAAFIDDAGSVSGIRLLKFQARNNNRGLGSAIIESFNNNLEIDERCVLEPNASNTANPIQAAAGIAFRCPRMQVRVKDLPSGTNGNPALYFPNRRTWISRAYIVTTNTVAQSDVDYTTLRIWNIDIGNEMASISSRVTGGVAINSLALTPFSANVFTALSQIEGGKGVRLAKEDTGLGRDINDALIILDYIPFGVT